MTTRTVANPALSPLASRRRANDRRSLPPEALEARIAPAAVLTATKVDVFAPGGDVNGDGLFQPGDTILYTVTITNGGDVDLTGVTFQDVIDPNTTLGAVNVSPLAMNDTFTAVANTLLEVGVTHGTSPAAIVSGSVTGNDVEFLGDVFTLRSLNDGATTALFSGGSATLTTSDGGTVTMNANGTFTFLPGVGFTGTDTWTYRIADRGLDGMSNTADDLTSVGTVTITVQGTDGTSTATAPVVWYVDNTYTGANGPSDGRSTRPYTSLAPLNATATDPDGTGDTLFVHTGSGPYTGQINLEASQRLQGQGNALTINGFNLVAAGTAPTINGAGAVAVVLGTDNVLRGFTTASTTLPAVLGQSFGTLDVQNVTINSPGQGLRLTTGSFAAGSQFNSITTASGPSGIDLTDVNGPAGSTIDLGGGSLQGSNNKAEFFVSGGNAQLLYSGNITNTLSRSVDISGHSTGNITLSGNLNDTSTGVWITNNPSGTITFSGASKAINTGPNPAVTYTGNGASFQFIGGNLDIDTTSGAGINAAGNTGAFNITGSGNSITTASGTPLTVSNSIIGALGVTFASITATDAAANGIVLLNTGSAGGFTVTGATNLGTAAGAGPTGTAISIVNHDGGVSFSTVDINRRGGTGILLDDVAGTATFGATTIPNQAGAGGYGIRVEDSSANITFASATISNTVQTDATDDATSDGIPDDEGNGDAIFLTRNSGSFRLNGGSLTNLAADGIDMRGSSGDLRVTGVLIQGIGLASGSGVNVDDTGISVRDLQGNLVIRNTQIQNFHGQNDGGGNEHGVWVVQTGTSFGTIELDNVDFDNDAATGIEGGNGFELRTSGTVNGNVKIHNGSSFTDLSGEGVDFQLNSAGQLNIEIGGSTFGPSIQDPDPLDATILAALNGISWAQNGSGTVFINIHNNTLTDTHTANANAGQITGTAQGTSKLIARIANNTINGDAIQNQRGRSAIWLTAGNSGVATDAPTQFDVDITGNTINNTDDEAIMVDLRGFAMNNATSNVSITNNVMGTTTAVSSRAEFEGTRIRVRDSESIKTMNFLFQGNTIINDGNSVGDETLDLKVESANNTLNATVVSNTITNNDTGTSPAVAFRAQSGFSGTIQGGTLNLDVRLNTINTVSGSETADYEIFENAGNVFIEGAGTGTVTAANLQAQNTSGVARVVGAVTFNNGANVTMPTVPSQPTIPTVPLMFAPTAGDVVVPADAGASTVPSAGGGTVQTGSGSTPTGGGTPVVIVDDGVLSQAELESLVSAAKARWIASGLTAAQKTLLESVTFSVADLPGWYLGSASAGHITLDSNAAGNSWFIDATPLDDFEFSGAGTQLSANAGLAAGRIDALTTIMHELGHQLGVNDSYDAADRANLMYGYLHQSERRLPAAGQAAGAVPDNEAFGGPDFAIAPINIGSLPVGKSVQVVFTAQINQNITVPNVTNQGTVSSTQTGSVQTDDPSVVGTANPTVTPVDIGSLSATLDGSGNLTITDTVGVVNSLSMVVSGSNLVISDPNEKFQPGGPGALSNGSKTLTIPLSSVTGSITFHAGAGNDQLTLDLSGGDFINAGGVDFNGGNPTTGPGDRLVISGGAQGTVTYNYTNATDGSVVMSNFGTVRYTGLEPVANSGTATNVIFNLPATGDTVFLEDNGATPTDGMLRLRSAGGTFEQTDFDIPTGSLTINLGGGNDTFTISAAPEFTASLTINGDTGDDTINLGGTINFAAGANLNVDLQNDDATPGIDTINVASGADYVLSGAGAAIFKASRNIVVTGRLATENGNITLEANQQAIAAAGNFVGVNVLGTGIVENTGTGAINILGRGGNDAAGQQYGFRTNTGALVRGGTTGDAVTITGTGGATSGNGIFIPNGAVRSLGGNILFTGIGTGTGTGITIQNSGVVSPAAGGNVLLDATTATPTSATAAFNLFTLATNPTGAFTSGGGNITVLADSISISTANSFSFLDAGATGTVTLRPKTNGTAIELGPTTATAVAGVLQLSDGELDRIIAGTLQIGDANSGAITITDVISPNAYPTLSIGKAVAFTTGTTTGGFASDVFSATNYEKIRVAGAVTIDPAATLTVTAQGGFVPSVADSFTIIENTSAAATTGTFAGKPEGSTVPVGGVDKTLTYSADPGDNDVVLIGTGVSVALGATTAVAEDSGGSFVYTFTRNGDLTGPLTVNFTVSGGAVFTSGTDTDYTQTGAATFGATAGTVTFQPNSATATVTITPRADTVTENNETVVLTVAPGSGYGTLGSPATATIQNDDTTVFVSGEVDSVAEDPGDTLVYTFRRAGVLTNALTVNVNIAGSATFTTDYTQNGAATYSGTTATLTFAPGSDTATITLTPVADSIVEPNETVQMTVATGTGYNVDPEINSLTGTITNDDATVSVSVSPASIAEDSAAGNFLTYTFTRAGFTGSALTVNFTASGTATKDTDYAVNGASFIGLAGTVTFAPNSTTAIVTVDPTADLTAESNETVVFTVNSGSGYTIATTPDNAATGTILDDDTSVSVAVSGSPIAENAASGTVMTYTFTRTGETSQPLTINFSAGGSANFGNDYTIAGAASFSTSSGIGTVTFAPGSSTAEITLTPNNDTRVEGTEDATIFVNTGAGYGVGTSPASGSMTDNDTATIAFSSLTSSVGEGSFASIGVTLTTFGNGVEGAGTLERSFTVSVSDLGGGTATGGGVDYTFNGQNITFEAGEDGLTVVFFPTTVNDTISEGGETFRLGLSAEVAPGSAVTVDSAPHVATILDNDIDLKLTAAGPLQPSVAGSGTSNVVISFTVQNTGLTNATNIDIGELFTLPTGVSFESASAPSGTTFSQGGAGGTWTLPTLAVNETATLTLSFTAGAATAAGAMVTVNGAITSAGQTLTNTEDDSASASATVIRQSDLVLTKADSPDPVGPGTQLVYTITVFNNGPSDNTLANVTDVLPVGFSNATWTSSVNGTPGTSGTGNVDVGASIPAQGTLVITVTGTVTAASNTTLTNTASLTSSEDTNTENNSDTESTFIGGVDLKLTKAADAQSAVPGSVVKYTLTYRNGGFITANGTNITDTIPANVVFDLANSSAGWQDSGGNTLADGAAAGTAIRFPLGSLPVSETGGTVVLAVRVTATVAAGASTIDNTATIADNGAGGTDLTPADNTATASTALNAAPDYVLTVAKNHYTNGGQDLDVAETRNLIARGHEIRYTYSFSNVGNQDGANVVLTAQVPAGTSFDFGNSSTGWSQTGPSTFTFSLESLPAGAQAGTVIFAVDIDQTRTAGLKKIDSTATIDDQGANGADPTPTNNTVTTSTTLYEGLYAVANSRQGGAIGAGSPPVVRVFDVTTGLEAPRIMAYEPSYRDGVRIAIGDINGDGFDDIVTATREGSGRIRVFDGLTHERLSFAEGNQINAFTGRQARGAYIALSDTNNDGRLDIVAGSGLGGGGLKVFSGVSGSEIETLTPFGAGYKGGIRVAGGDVNGDGRGDVVAGEGSFGSKVRVYFQAFGGEALVPRALDPDALEFQAGAPRLRDGVFISTGDATGDGVAEIIVGRGKTGGQGGASVGIFKVGFSLPGLLPGLTATEIKTIPLANDNTYRFGARVAATDVNFDGIADIIVGSGHLGGSKVQILDGVTGNQISSFTAFPSPRLGVWTAAGAPPVPAKRF